MSASEWWCRLLCHFFCRLSVTKTQSSKWRDEESWLRDMPSLMKAIYLMHSCFVCLCSALGTFSHTCTSASPRSGQLLQACPLPGKVLWILRKGWGGERRLGGLFVVLHLNRSSCMILVAIVKVLQCCARRLGLGRHVHDCNISANRVASAKVVHLAGISFMWQTEKCTRRVQSISRYQI